MKVLLISILFLTVTAAFAMETEDPVTEQSLQSDSASTVDSILSDALSYLGTPYIYGGTDSSGFDCSGLAYRVFGDNGIPLPRTVSGMESVGEPVDAEDLEPGDLLIFYSPKHVGIYLGEGEFIHSSSWQGRGVVITSLEQANYARRYSSARRVL